MNRHRLNQILEVLLFPVTDFKLGKKDILLQYYQAYHQYMKQNSSRRSDIVSKEKARKEYQNCQRELIDYLSVRCCGKMKSEDDILMLCNLFYPMEKMQRIMSEMQKLRQSRGLPSIDKENVSIYYLRKMSEITASLITYRDGTAAVRQWVDNQAEMDLFQSNSVYNKVSIWNLLCRITVPDVYIVMAAVDNKLGMEALYEQKSYIILADKLLNKVLQKGLAENHMHFNVGMDYEVVWLRYMNLRFLEERNGNDWEESDYQRLGFALYRCLAACYVEENDFVGFDRWLGRKKTEAMSGIVYTVVSGDINITVSNDDMWSLIRFYNTLSSGEEVREGDYLLDKVYRKYLEYKVSSEFIFLYQCYRHIRSHEEDTFFARSFLQYLRFKNTFFYDRQEGHILQGLRYFQRKYGRMKSSAMGVMQKSDAMLEAFRFQAKIDCLKKLEIRVAPNVSENEVQQLGSEWTRKIIMSKLYDQIYEILYAYRRYLLECLIGVRAAWALLKEEEKGRFIGEDLINLVRRYEHENIRSAPALGIIFHFIKTEQSEDISDAYCWRSIGEGGVEKMPLRMRRRYFITDIAIALETMRSTVPGLDKYLVGIDAVSEENAMEPWIFAQAYKLVRSHFYTKPVLKNHLTEDCFQRIQNIGFTYHVGEDFRHIVSGFRHTDEVLDEFGYKAGDRLGHGLVLGLDVTKWVSDNEVVPMPKMERLENLLWMWGVNIYQTLNIPVQLEILENKIMDIAQEIYEKPESITVKMLYQAYKNKFHIDHAEIADKVYQKCMKDGETDCVSCRNSSEWDSNKLLMTSYCPFYIQKYEEIILVPVTREEAAIYQKLQEYLIRKIEKKGIYLEINPTSNLSIGDFSKIKNHPIFELSDLQKNSDNHVMITVNSDDPAVFNTNVENEMAYIYYAADELGYSKSEILEWIERIRNQGMEASFIKHEKSVTQSLGEIQQIMDCIRKINT